MGFYPSEGDVDSNGAEEVNLKTSAGVELLGQQASAASLPVVIASDQSTIPVTDAALTNASQKTQIVDSAGLIIDARDINSTPVNGDIGLITNSIIYGHTTAGGGAYVEVKVTPSGAVLADVTGSTITANQGTSPWVTTPKVISTYSASAVAVVPAAAATDVFTIIGSASKTVRIRRISASVTTTAGSGLALTVQLIKRSTANTGGTSTTPTVVPYDSTNAAATAVVRNYTANPTLGTAVGTVVSRRARAATTGTEVPEAVWIFGGDTQPIVLNGVAQQLSINFNGATITAPVACFTVEWTEE